MLTWEGGTQWTTVHSTTTGTGGVQAIDVSGAGRHVRMCGTTRATGYGCSLWEFQVYGTTGGQGNWRLTVDGAPAVNRPPGALQSGAPGASLTPQAFRYVHAPTAAPPLPPAQK